MPAARRSDGVDTRLRARDGDRPGGDARARRFEARHDQRAVEFAHVREARREAHHVDRVDLSAMQANDLLNLQMKMTRNSFEIDPEFPAVSHRDFDPLRIPRRYRLRLREFLAQEIPDLRK
ncbi:MAG: hypothetical protein MZV64_60415 [Ignavibacteriales bacterium]|nr:hypothetical protein [Ignavibacteriales bacterium]